MDLESGFGVAHFLSRKAAHLTEYAILMILVHCAACGAWPEFRFRMFLPAFLFCLFYSLTDEWHQTFVFGRTGNFFDIFVDSLGALIGFFVYRYKRTRLRAPALLAVVIFSLCACVKDKMFKDAKKLEKLGRYVSAVNAYEKFFTDHPNHPKAPESLYQIGRIYSQVYNDCARAQSYFERVRKNYSQSVWAREAEYSAMNCPDYFPFNEGLVYEFVDSQSLGKNMRRVMELATVPGQDRQVKVKDTIYAGNELVGRFERNMKKISMELREFELGSSSYNVVLKYPLQVKSSWETKKNGKLMRYVLADAPLVLQVASGEYRNCIKVEEREKGSSSGGSWKCFYYAPATGLILTTAATIKNETRIAELRSVKPKTSDPAAVPKISWRTKLKNQFKSWMAVKDES